MDPFRQFQEHPRRNPFHRLAVGFAFATLSWLLAHIFQEAIFHWLNQEISDLFGLPKLTVTDVLSLIWQFAFSFIAAGALILASREANFSPWMVAYLGLAIFSS